MGWRPVTVLPKLPIRAFLSLSFAVSTPLVSMVWLDIEMVGCFSLLCLSIVPFIFLFKSFPVFKTSLFQNAFILPEMCWLPPKWGLVLSRTCFLNGALKDFISHSLSGFYNLSSAQGVHPGYGMCETELLDCFSPHFSLGKGHVTPPQDNHHRTLLAGVGFLVFSGVFVFFLVFFGFFWCFLVFSGVFVFLVVVVVCDRL